MTDLENLEEVLQLINKQGELLDLMEEMQAENEQLKREKNQLAEQLDESLTLNEQLLK